jgi:hypothetical protein
VRKRWRLRADAGVQVSTAKGSPLGSSIGMVSLSPSHHHDGGGGGGGGGFSPRSLAVLFGWREARIILAGLSK